MIKVWPYNQVSIYCIGFKLGVSINEPCKKKGPGTKQPQFQLTFGREWRPFPLKPNFLCLYAMKLLFLLKHMYIEK